MTAIPEVVVEAYTAGVTEANALATEYRSQTGNEAEKVEAWLSSTDNAEVVKVREWLANARQREAEIKAKIAEAEANLQEVGRKSVSENSDYDAEAAETRFLELRKDLTAKRKGIEALFGEDAFNALQIEEVISLKQKTTRTGSGDGKGAGVSRSSFSEVTVNGEALDKPTPSEAAAYISKNFGKVTAGELRESLKSAHGDVSDKIGETFTFAHTVTNKNGEQTTVNVSVTPTENVRRQPKSDDTSDSAAE